MRRIKRVVGAAVLGLGIVGAGSAHANVVMNLTASGPGTETFSGTTGPTTTDFTATFGIPQFDSTLGSLTSISVVLSGSMSALGSVTNSGANNANAVNLQQSSTITDNPPQDVSGSFGAATVTGGSPNGDSFLVFTTSATAGKGLGTLASGATVSDIPLSGTFTSVTLSQFSNFDPNLIGTGLFNITFASGEYTTTGGSGGNLSNQVTTQDDITLTVTYTYNAAPPPPTDTPEPASLALLGAGLAGVGMIRRRKR